MELMRRFPVADKYLDPIQHSHGLDGFTRLAVRIGRLDEVQQVRPPLLYWDTVNHQFAWHFPIERRSHVPWEKAVPAIHGAIEDFIIKCTPKSPSEGSNS